MSHEIIESAEWQELAQAIQNDDPVSVATLVSQMPELLHAYSSSESCLHFAVSIGRVSMVRMLVNLGADINLDLEEGGTPLREAASKGQFLVVKYLVMEGAIPDISRPDRNPIFAAIVEGHVDIVRLLLKAGADPHVVYRGLNGKLMNALSFSHECDQFEIADRLTKAGCRMPIEGEDEPMWEPEEFHHPTEAETARDQIVEKMAEIYGRVDSMALQEIVPVHDGVSVSVNVIRPNEKHPFLTLFTTGMSSAAMPVPEGEERYQYAELIIHLPPTWPHPRAEGLGEGELWPLQWLRNVAYIPHLHETWLGGPMTIVSSDDPPVPLGPNTKQTCLLLLADFVKWSPMVLENGKTVRFYTVIPIYTEERDFEKENGVVPLLQRLQKAGYTESVMITRKNVARMKS